LVLVAMSVLLYQLNSETLKLERDQKTALALAEAKAALIGFAITYDDSHPGELYGYLPCPDLDAADNNGEGSELVCGNANVSSLGRFPWKTLKMEPLKDGVNECLWYAVSGSYKNNPKTPGITPTTLGTLNVLSADGVNYLAGTADPAVAVIFAPGSPLEGQDRVSDVNAVQCGGNYAASAYLDTDAFTNINNAVTIASPSANSTLVAAANSESTASNLDKFNDSLIIITRDDIFASYCKKYAKTLLSYVSASNSNDCNDGVGAPIASCTTASNNLQYCSAACKTAAQTFISSSCLANITDANCQAAITTLEACNA
jgi:hypothetical protein